MEAVPEKKQEDESDLHLRMKRDGGLKKLAVAYIPREDDYGDGDTATVGGQQYFYLRKRGSNPPLFVNQALCKDTTGFPFAKQIQRHLGKHAIKVNGDPQRHELLGMNRLQMMLSRKSGYANVFVDPVPAS